MKTNFCLSLCLVAVVTLTVLLVLKKSLWTELEILLGILSLFMFIYLFLILYYGVRFDRNERYTVAWSNLGNWLDATSGIDTGGSFTEGGSEAGLLGIVLGFILDLLISICITIIIAVVLWFSVNLLWSTVIILCMPLFFFFSRSLRYVVAKGRSCRRNAGRSFVFALRATLINTVWLYAILEGAHYIAMHKGT